MRIVAVADTHLYHDELMPLPDGDVLVHAGDMLRFGDLDELAEFCEWFARLPHATKIVVAGNHERCFESHHAQAVDMLGPDVHYLQDSGIQLGGLRWWGSPWQPEYRDWAFNLPRGAALRERWSLIPDDTDVLITHTPPLGLGDRGPVGGRDGCEELARRVAELRPLLHLFGHIHQDGGLWTDGATTSANVTTWECDRRPTVLDVDAEARTVEPVEVPPRGE